MLSSSEWIKNQEITENSIWHENHPLHHIVAMTIADCDDHMEKVENCTDYVWVEDTRYDPLIVTTDSMYGEGRSLNSIQQIISMPLTIDPNRGIINFRGRRKV